MDKVTKKIIGCPGDASLRAGFALQDRIKAALASEDGFAGLFPGIGLFLVGSTQKIVYTDSIEICKCVQHGNGNVQPAQLIIGICGLMHPKQDGKIFLL